MKKKIYLPLTLIVVFICGLIPFNFKKTITIDYPYLIVFKQLSAGNWEKWQPQLKPLFAKNAALIKLDESKNGFTIKAPDITIQGKTEDGFKFEVDKNVRNTVTNFTYVAVPQSNAGKCSVVVTVKTSTFTWFWNLLSHKPTDIDALKNYMYDTKAFYGYEITRGKVIDSNIMVQKKIVPIAAKNAEIVKVQQQLNAYLKLHHIKQEQPIMADIRNISKDSALVMIGIPIIGRATNDGDLKFMHLPRNGNMLSASYKGPYAGRLKLYDAIKAYFSYHSMSSPEVPYEKFLDNKIPTSDTAMVNMQVNIPIY